MKNFKTQLRFCSLVILVLFQACTSQDNELHWDISDSEYLETQGFEVLAFHNTYYTGKQGGIEFIHHGERIASNGFLILDVPGYAVSWPKTANRSVDRSGKNIQVAVDLEKYNLKYTLNMHPDGSSLLLTVNLEKPLPDELKGHVYFGLSLFPTTFIGKSYQLGNNYGVFPVDALGPVKAGDRSILDSYPLATGSNLILAQEDPQIKMQIEQSKGEMMLIDSRDGRLGEWFTILAPLQDDLGKNLLEWKITTNLIKDWKRKPVIGFSQVGYHPDQKKRAVIELDKNTESLESARLQKLDTDGKYTEILKSKPEKWGDFLRYQYAIFDFSSVKESGLYQITYGDIVSEPFSISKNVLNEKVWQPTLELFFPVQMCHMRVKDRNRVWHGACHLDDGIQAPLSTKFRDGFISYEKTETPYQPFQAIPHQNVGGWHDAGDYDVSAGSQARTTFKLVLAREAFGISVDQTTVDQKDRFVQMRKPDGIPDLEQQVEHGVLALLAGYRAAGHVFPGIIAGWDLRAFIGDVASLTDQLTYDPHLNEDERTLTTSGKKDDRWVFTNDDTSLEYQVITALAAASRVLRSYNETLAEECLQTAVKAWEIEQNREPLSQQSSYVPNHPKLQEILATTELLITTKEDRYKNVLIELLPNIKKNIKKAGWTVLRAFDLIEDKAFKDEIEIALTKYAAELKLTLASNPYGIPWNPEIWGEGWKIQRYAMEHYYLTKAYPELFDRENILSVVNYALGCHPASNTSLVSAVGAHSLTTAYGANLDMWSYIPGGIPAGPALVRPDLPELKEPFPYLWQQSEYVMWGAASYIFCVLAADDLLNNLN